MSDAGPAPEDDAEHGEKKSFWDHLRDLRTALLRSAIAIGVALMLCLFVADKLVAILEVPLDRMQKLQRPKPTVAFNIGATKLGPFEVTPEQFHGLPGGDNPHMIYQIGTAKIGNEQVLTVKPEVDPAGGSGLLRIRLHNLSPADAFFVAFHVAIYGAIIVASPFWIFFMGQFFLPALSIRERGVLYQWFGWGLVLFLLGVAITYFLLLPLALRASVVYSNALGFEATDWRADGYLSFVTKFIVGMGVGFQFPIVVLLLVKLGLLTHRQLAHYRRHVVVLSLVLGAVLTTPEVITQVAMAIPLYILYEISIWIAWYWDWKRRKAAAAVGA
ncbi:MAG TPA: twin-arginine translocase subunit TatC [Opitutus sp.]|nr:twin-arginine translocase subunit TatC [Opitutus sp.]